MPDSHVAKDAIDYLYSYGIVSGGYDDFFLPDNNITREQFVKILILAFGLYDTNAVSNFTDSEPNDWHYSYISSAVKIGVVNGLSEEEFGVGVNIQRQELVAMAYRVADFTGYDFGEAENNFSDIDDAQEYAVTAINSIPIPFASDGVFMPSIHATRAEACMMIYLMLESDEIPLNTEDNP